MIPQSREQFKDFCIRKITGGVLEINLSDEAIEDRIDEALKVFSDFHYDGFEKTYYKYQIQEADKTNRYITLPSNIIGMIDIFPLSSSMSSHNLYSVQYQFVTNELYNLNNVNLVPYYMTMQHIDLINEILIGKQPLRYNRYVNKLYIDMDWSQVNVGDWLIVEAYKVIDPEEYPKIWSDKWLQRYCTALIKENWGSVMSKYTAMPMPGGISFNGQAIKEEGKQEKAELEYELINTYSLPSDLFIG